VGDNRKQLPTRIQLLKWGVNDSTEGPVIVNELTLSSFAAMQRKIGRERAPLDFEHNTVPGTPEYERTKEPRDIAAMATPLASRDGIFLENLDYKVGQDVLGKFEDVSAAPLLNKDRVVVGLHSAALTRTGAVYGAHFAAEDVLKLAGEGITLAAFSSKISASLLGADASKQQQNKNMPEKYISVATLAAIVGMNADAEENAVIETLKKRLAPVEIQPLAALVKDGKVVLLDTVSTLDARLKKIEDAGNKSIATLSATIDGKVHTFSAEDIVRLATRVGDLEKSAKDTAASITDKEKNRILPLFASEGKVPKKADGSAYSADELKALDLPTLQLLHANTPVTVPLAARRAAGEKRADENGCAVNSADVWSK
jgi:hypothetical protein